MNPQIGDRVFVAGTIGGFGKVTAVTSGPLGTQYMVWLDGHKWGHSGPFTDVKKHQ